MKLFRVSLAAVAIGLFSLSTVQAGSGTLKHSDGSKVKLKCNGGGCYETFTDANGNKGVQVKVGKGGRSNYLAHKKAWKSKGYK